MNMRNPIKVAFYVSAGLTAFFFAGALYMFLHTFYFCSDSSVKTWKDPRWRVFDYNSRQATESEIYAVAEIPAVTSVSEISRRLLRFEFTPPVPTDSWTIHSKKTGEIYSRSTFPEIQFPDAPYSDTFTFVPEGIDLVKDITMTISFGPSEGNYQRGLSWPDNYWKSYSSVPFTTTKTFSIDEWVGLPDDDPEIIEARGIIDGSVDMQAPALERSEQVFRFIMDRIRDSGGTPDDRVQASSPLETYKLFVSGEGKGWCENNALVYYLFANAAGVKTRFVDLAGKFGPLKLTGHYFCESWLPEEAGWCYVDPQSRIANIARADGLHINTLELKRLHDLGALSGCTVRRFDRGTGELITQTAEEAGLSPAYFLEDMVIAYKFGYGNNKSTSKIRNFFTYTTLLYAPFPVPKLYLYKIICLKGFAACFIISILLGFGSIFLNRMV